MKVCGFQGGDACLLTLRGNNLAAALESMLLVYATTGGNEYRSPTEQATVRTASAVLAHDGLFT